MKKRRTLRIASNISWQHELSKLSRFDSRSVSLRMGKTTWCFFRWLSKLLLLRRKHVRKKRSAAVRPQPTHINMRRTLSVKTYRVAGAFLGHKAASRPSQRCWTRG